jgi:MSHA biogenesis protein MshN
LVPIPFGQNKDKQNNDQKEVPKNELTEAMDEPNAIKVKKKFDNVSANEWYVTQLDKALESIDYGDDEAGIQRLTLIISKFPASVDARETLAALYLSQENFTNAELVLDEGLEFQPHAINLIMLKARLLIAKKNSKEALALLEKYNPDIQDNPEYYGLMAAIYETMGRIVEAGSLYQALVEVDPENGQYWLGFGLALEKNHSVKQAIEAYRHASKVNNTKPEIRMYAENKLRTLQG